MFVYLLASTASAASAASASAVRTYIGATKDVQHRLRQHNRELSGGAKCTAGRQWTLMCFTSGFPDWRATLQFEWAWKYMTKKQGKKGIAGRIAGLHALLQKEKPTSNALPYKNWSDNFTLHVPSETHGQLEKIEGWSALTSGSRSDHRLTSSPTSLSYILLPIMSSSSSSSSSSVSNDVIMSLVTQMAETNKLLTRLLIAQGAAAGLDLSDMKPDGKGKGKGKGKGAAKAPRAKVVAPAPLAGVIRFGSKKEGDYTQFSHMFEAPVNLDGKEYPSIAHYINSVKYLDPTKAGVADDAGNLKAEAIRTEKNVGKVRVMGLGKEYTRPDWESVRLDLFKKALSAKFSSHTALKDKLLGTSDALLEDASQDDFWGIGKDGKGANHGGKMLMQVRVDLGGKKPTAASASSASPAPTCAGAASTSAPTKPKPAARARVVPNPPKMTQSTQAVDSESEEEESDD